MKRLSLLFLIIFSSVAVFAEIPVSSAEAPLPAESSLPDRTSMIGISLGYTLSGFREETIFDTNRYINAFVFSIHSVLEKENFIHSFNAGFYSGRTELLVEHPVYNFEQVYYYQIKDIYTRVFLEYSLVRKLWGNDTFPGYLGGAVRGDLYLLETLDNPLYINLSLIASLNLYASQKWVINNKNSLVLTLSFPFFGYAARPHYAGFAWPLETGVTGLNNYWACFGSLKYYYKISSLFSLYSDIGFELSHIDFPSPRKDASLQIKIGAVYMY
ncbi:MAG: hypothetical protein LBU88_10245 [Treponema sp.]|jgi:hypothetical protein|nr:hypothetical protein [Treponema sp.]